MRSFPATFISLDASAERTRRGVVELFLVREASGDQTLTCVASLPSPLRPAGSRCRAFLFEAELIARLRGLMGSQPWEDAFRADRISGLREVAQVLAATPELDGVTGERELLFPRVGVPDRGATLPPLRQPLHVRHRLRNDQSRTARTDRPPQRLIVAATRPRHRGLPTL